MNSKNTITKKSLGSAEKKIVRQIKDIESIDPSEIRLAWKEIKKEVAHFSVFKRKPVISIISMAASIALILATGSYFIYYAMKKNADELSVTLLRNNTTVETGDEILLVADEEKLKLQDESFIHYEADGKMSVNGEIENIVDKKSSESKINELIVPKGKRANLTFSDGTIIYVNSDSRVIYPPVFKGNERNILVEGEVFLDVREDKSLPFIVRTHGFEVKVLGTQFNINSYKKEVKSSVVLVSGSVEVVTNMNQKAFLRPNQLMEIEKDYVKVRDVDIFEYVCWKDNMISLNDNTAGDILERLSRYYGRTIIYDDKVREVLSISGKLDIKETVEEAVEVVCLSLSLKYTIDENNNIVVTLK